MTSSAATVAEQLDLPRCDQIGFVYRDLDAAIQRLTPVFGPFTRYDYGEMDWDYRGVETPSKILLALGQVGPLEIELIEWVSGGTPHKEFLDAGREGMQHMRFAVDDMDEMIERAAPLGWRPVWSKRFGEGLAAAYMECAGDPLLLEFFENRHG